MSFPTGATVFSGWDPEGYGHDADFAGLVEYLELHLMDTGKYVDTGHWQALKDVPQTRTIELRSVVMSYGIPEQVSQLMAEVKPNMPWAEHHFLERVGGEPLNPGETYREWPWYQGNVETHKGGGQFSHTYMERYWPKQAGDPFVDDVDMAAESKYNRGLRYRYGDLNDVVSLLTREPYTRQAVLPVWFPEDTGAVHGGRVPCSLTYHFMLREGKLHCAYTIRSCDLLRHFRDDVYLTCRLVQWVLDQVRESANRLSEVEIPSTWDNVVPGELTMFIHSLHVFEGDLPTIRRRYGAISSTD